MPPARSPQDALDAHLLESLRPLSIGLALMYVGLLVAKPFLTPGLRPLALAAWQLGVLLLFIALWLRLRRRAPPTRLAHPIAAGIVALVVVDAGAHMALRGNPLEALSFGLILIGIAFFFTDWRWFVATVGVVVVLAATLATLVFAGRARLDVLIAIFESVVLAGIVFFFRHRTLRRMDAVEADLRRHAALLVAQNEASTAGILVVDDAGQILSYNRRFVEMWGLPPSAIESGVDSVALASAVPKLADPEAFLARVRELYAAPDASGWDTVPLADGRVFERYTAPVRGPEGMHYGRVWFFHDVTERERAAAHIRELNRDLEARIRQLAGVNHDLESFAYSVSHDLRAPLRAVAYHASVLREDHAGKIGPDGLAEIGAIEREATRMRQMVEDVLTLARGAKRLEGLEPVDISKVAEELVHELRRADPGRNVEVEIAPGLVARGDPNLLRIVLSNLLANAWKFTRPKPHARIEIGRRDGTFFVRDNGVGFDPARAGRLFREFQRLHGPSFEGTGVGLANVRRVIERHGGRIWAEGKPNEGATFYFTLPT